MIKFLFLWHLIQETVSSLRSAAKSPKDQGILEESAKTKSGRKREHGGREVCIYRFFLVSVEI